MVAYYQHDIAAWMDGTEGLSDGAYRMYHVICQLIYLHDGPITYNIRGLASRCGQRVELATRYYIPELINAGKIKIENGKVSNARCQSELSRIETRRAARKASPIGPRSVPAADPVAPRSGSAPGPLPSKPLETQDPQLMVREKSIGEESRKDSPPARRRGQADLDLGPAGDWPKDYQAQFWAAYPRKTEKKAALAKLDAIRKSGVRFAILMAGVENLNEKVRRERTPEKYIKHPTTWLNRGCWEDQFNQGDQNEEARRPREDNIFTLAAGFKARTAGASA